MTPFEEADARLGAMHGYEAVQALALKVFAGSVRVSREGMAELERFQQATAKRRWKLRYRMERLSRRVWNA